MGNGRGALVNGERVEEVMLVNITLRSLD